MKKGWKKGILALLCGFIALSAGGFVACDGSTPPPSDGPGQEGPATPSAIATPTVTFTDNGAEWPAVQGATAYRYKINGGAAQFTTERVVALQENDVFEVMAVGDGDKNLDSPWSATVQYTWFKLSKPQVSLTGNRASWTAVENAVGYTYQINGGEEEYTEDLYVDLTDGQSVRVKAVAGGYPHKDSSYSAYTDVFVTQRHTVTFKVDGVEYGTATVEHNGKVTPPATNPTKVGYTFTGWNFDFDTTITQDTEIAAIFEIKTYTITVTAGNGGTVTGSGTYDHGASVTLTATPDEGYKFVKWSDGNTNATRTFTATVDITLTAEFAVEINTYTITVTAGNGGTVTGAGAYDQGASVTLTATPDEGYKFVKWSDGDTNATRTFTATEDITLTAEFAVEINTYTITVTAGNGGKVTGAGTYDHGASVTLTATPDEGYKFVKWSDGNTNATRTFTAMADKTLTAEFAVKTYTVTVVKKVDGVTVTNNNVGKVTGAGEFNHGEYGTLTAETLNKTDYVFVGWYDGETLLTEDESYDLENVTADKTLTVKWESKEVGEEEAGYNYFYFTQLGDDVMPIGAWTAPPPNKGSAFPTNQVTLSNYQVLAESGINVAYALEEIYNGVSATSSANVLNALDYAGQVGIVYMVRDLGLYDLLKGGYTDRANERMAQYASKPAFGGYLMKDEPGYTEFSKLGTATNTWYQTSAAGNLNLVNNLPTYAEARQLYYGAGATAATYPTVPYDYNANYEEWVRTYIETVNPQVFSYDFYPFSGQASGLVHSDYYKNMSIVRKVCMEENIPFWTFAQAGTFDGSGGIDYAQVAIQMNTALAYGAKGVQWFNYWQPLEFSAEKLCALVDHYGNKTKYYDMVQKVNRQIAAVDHVLLKSKSTGIIQIGNSGMGAIPTEDKLTSYGALTSATGIGDAIIGCFDYRDQGYAYYVSSNNFYQGATVTLNFDGAYALEKIQDGTSRRTTTSAVTVSVPAGEGVLIVVPKQKATTSTTYRITVNNDDASAGYAIGSGTYGAGSEVTVGAMAKLGYVFDGWYAGSTKVAATEAYTFTPNANVTLTAKWVVDPNPLLLNDFESIGSVDAPVSASTSSSHVFQGQKSVSLTYSSGHYLNIKLLDVVDLETLKATCSQIKLNVYSTAAVSLELHNNRGKTYALSVGDNVVTINTADLTASNFSGNYLTVWTSGACTLYLDNLIGIFGEQSGEVLLNACDDTAGFWCTAGTTLNTNADYIVEGSGSVCISTAGWAPINVYWGTNSITDYEYVKMTIWADQYVRLLAGDINYINDPDCVLAELNAGRNDIEIPVSKLVKYGLTASQCAPYMSGACTLYIDNIVGVR